MIIYKATNLINGKVYIGQTINVLKKRKINHLARANKGSEFYFHNAIRKYGFDNFRWQVICICPNIDILNEQEEYYITFYDSMNVEKGYNLTSGGGNCITSESTRMKISKLKSGKNHPMYGKKHSKESIQKIKDGLPDRRGKNHWNYGKHYSKETREKMSNTHKERLKTEKHPFTGRKLSEEHKAKLTKAGTNRIMSKETRKKMSESQKIRWAKIKEQSTIDSITKIMGG